MSATLEPATIETVIDQASPEQRRYLVQKLLSKDMQEYTWGPIPVADATGQIVGFYMPRFHSRATEPPKISDEEQAELDRRLNSLNDTITFDEMKKRLGLTGARPQKRQ